MVLFSPGTSISQNGQDFQGCGILLFIYLFIIIIIFIIIFIFIFWGFLLLIDILIN